MIKFSLNTDWDFGVEPCSLITDVKSMVKRAAAKPFLQYEKTQGQTDLHVIALGAYEGTGFNRNGDAFSEADCIKNAHLFKKANRAVHRNHKNKANDPKFGNIKAQAYNPDMKRIELIVGLDNDKCQDILHKVQEGKEVYWSMASRQQHDVCSVCKHKARNDKERCKHIPAQLGELTKEGEMVGMHNPDPGWFEISEVGRPADRIGFTLAKTQSQSSFHGLLPSDHLKLYTGFQVPEEELLVSKTAQAKRQLISKLAELEKRVAATTKGPASASDAQYIKEIAPKLSAGDKLSDTTIDELRKVEPSKLFRVLAEHGVILSPEDFVKYLFPGKVKHENVEGMKSHLPSCASDCEDEGESCTTANDDAFDPQNAQILPQGLQRLIQSLVGEHSVFPSPVRHRVIRITITKMPKMASLKEKTASVLDKQLARTYLKYKVAQLNFMQEHGKLDDITLLNAQAQNLG